MKIIPVKFLKRKTDVDIQSFPHEMPPLETESLSDCPMIRTTQLEGLLSCQKKLQSSYDTSFNDWFNSGDHQLCPKCHAKRYRHGHFSLTVESFCDAPITINGQRIRCPHCGKTDRVKPAFSIPRYSINVLTADEIFDCVQHGKKVPNLGISTSSVKRVAHFIMAALETVHEEVTGFYSLLKEWLAQEAGHSSFKIFEKTELFQPLRENDPCSDRHNPNCQEISGS